MTEAQDIAEITPLELSERLEAGDVPVLVDVREHFERDIADLPDHGQLRIPTGEFMQRVSEIDPEDEVVLPVDAASGPPSSQKGYKKVLNLTGGVLGWRSDVDPSLRAY